MQMQKPWVQVAIDATSMERGKELATLARRAGADWIEAGTPLIYYESIRSIGELVKVSGDVPVVADYKAQDGVYKYFAEAARLGAKVATILAVVNDGSIREAIKAGKENGIAVCVDLFSVKLEHIAQRAKEVEAMGADYVMLHLGFDESRHFPARKNTDGLLEVLAAVNIPVGVGTFDTEDAIAAVRMGASYVVQGEPMLSSPEGEQQLSEFIRAVKAAV